MADAKTETFHPTNGRVVGVLGLLLVLALLVLGVVEGVPLWVLGLLATAGVLTWASVLRPGVRIAGDELVLRNMFVTVGVPLAAVEQVAVRRVLAVRAGDRRLVSPAISRPLRQTLRSGPRDAVEGTLATMSYPDFVEERIRAQAADHRERLGVKAWSVEQQALAEQVRRKLAWPEVAALALAVLLLLTGIGLELGG